MNRVVNKRRLTLCNRSSDLPKSALTLRRSDLTFTVHDSIATIEKEWDQTTSAEHFSKSGYLKTIERDSPENLANLYVLFYNKSQKVVGTLLLQHLVLRFADSFRYENYSTDHSRYARWIQRARQWVISLFKYRVITVGNLYLTGQFGYRYDQSELGGKSEFDIIDDTLKIVNKELCGTPFRFSGVLWKDYFENQRPTDAKKRGMSEFFFDPNMILNIDASWSSFDDYLLDMRSKYRIRLKNAIRKFGSVEKRELNLDEIRSHNNRIYFLYNEVLDGSGFVLAKGEREYFLTLKEELGDDLHLMGYFIDNKMIGFYTWVLDDGKMDSHFIGFDTSLNHKYQIYLNILLDLVKDSIAQKAKHLYYFRTALEIKSSVGAIPHEMSCYFRHNNFLLNRTIVPPLFGYFVPKQKWDQRHPFKEKQN